MTVLVLGLESVTQQPGRLWSLADMINSNYVFVLNALNGELTYLEVMGEVASGPPIPGRIAAVRQWLGLANEAADEFQMGGVRERIRLFLQCLDHSPSQSRLGTEARVLRETIEYEARQQYFYRYPLDKVAVLNRLEIDWAATLKSFPSARADIHASVDLWAMDHPTASVFHLMRVVEHGLRALAADLGKSFDVQQWHNVIDQIEKEIKRQAATMPTGLAKSDRLRFLSQAATEFRFFKDGWRNHVSHSRAIYDEHQARSVLDHVCSFMNGLSHQFSEMSEP